MGLYKYENGQLVKLAGNYQSSGNIPNETPNTPETSEKKYYNHIFLLMCYNDRATHSTEMIMYANLIDSRSEPITMDYLYEKYGNKFFNGGSASLRIDGVVYNVLDVRITSANTANVHYFTSTGDSLVSNLICSLSLASVVEI